MFPPIIIVGAGARGVWFMKLLYEEYGLKTSAVIEANADAHEMAKARAEMYGSKEALITDSLDKALDACSLDAEKVIFIMTPEASHLDIYRKAVGANSHVFLEKPLSANIQDTLEMLKLSRTTDKVTQVGFVLRYSNFYRRVKQVADSDVLGKIVTIQMNERLGFMHGASYRRNWRRLKKLSGGFLNEKCSHDFDLMCWFKKKQAFPREVFSYAGRGLFDNDIEGAQNCAECDDSKCPYRDDRNEPKTDSGVNRINGIRLLDDTHAPYGACVFRSDADIFNHQTVAIKFSDGAQGIFTALASSGDQGRDISIHGSKGCVYGNLENGALTLHEYWGKKTETLSVESSDAHGNGDPVILEEFIKRLKGDKAADASIEDGALASMIAFAADESSETGRAVPIPELEKLLQRVS